MEASPLHVVLPLTHRIIYGCPQVRKIERAITSELQQLRCYPIHEMVQIQREYREMMGGEEDSDDDDGDDNTHTALGHKVSSRGESTLSLLWH